ncbi:hypothetical protein DFS33DRAFT_1273479 [Desarmillaria ectypa]|nr:hypothetical protein DFS33DRAFT_1273479 [Desarmillaria ectypa]
MTEKSSRQREAIFHETSRLEDVITDYDRELTRLHGIITQLESGRAEVQTHVDSYTSLASAPIRRLRNLLFQSILSLSAQHDPDKILKRIFTFACYRDDDDPNSHLQWLTPLAISHVCSHWRKLSLNIPEMWSYLDVSQDLHPDSNLELLHTYLARTGMDTPLSVRIHLDWLIFCAYQHVLNAVLAHANRWRDAIIIVDHQQLWRFFSCHFDILESLVLRIGNIQSNHPIEYLKFAPLLRYVNVDAALSALLFPSCVRRMDLRGQANHPAVVRLEAYQLDAPDLHLSLFPTVTTPNLDRLSIVFGKGYTFDSSLFRSLLSLVERSECRLRAFSLDMTHCPGDHRQSHIEKLQNEDNELRDFLEGVPSITELRIVEPRGSECRHCNIVSMLLWWIIVMDHDNPSTLTLPYLKKLELVWTAEPDRGSLMPMVQSRIEERKVFGGNFKVGGEDISMSDAYDETSTCSSECDSDNTVVVSVLESLVIGTQGDVEEDSVMWEWMEDLRARGMVVHLW